eukprot:3692508-Prymnesium_polylepis.1
MKNTGEVVDKKRFRILDVRLSASNLQGHSRGTRAKRVPQGVQAAAAQLSGLGGAEALRARS